MFSGSTDNLFRSIPLPREINMRDFEEVQPPELMTVREVSDRLRVDQTTVRRWIKDGVLRCVHLPHVGKRTGYRVHRSTIEEMIKGKGETK